MTNYFDQLSQGAATYNRYARWNGSSPLNGMPTATNPYDTQTYGTPHTQTFAYQIGTASTALASGVFYSASGTATTGSTTLTGTGALVSGGVATFDVPRGVRFTASIDLSTTTLTVVGTDGYGSVQQHSFVGPTGNTIGNTGSYTDSLVTFKTVTALSITAAATGIGTTLMMIGDNNMFGLPFYVANVGRVMGTFINGQTATVPSTVVAGYTATAVTTASTPDVRGSVTLATVVLANDSRYITIHMVQPQVGLSASLDDKVHSYGAVPFGGS